MNAIARVWAIGLFATTGVMPFVSPAVAQQSAASVSRLEQLARKMLPEKQVNEAAGFFGPVVRKYQPVLEKFRREYAAAKDKKAVALKYVPQVDAALADARKMRVPAKYEAKKAEYLQMFEAFVLAAKFYVQLGRPADSGQ